MVHEDIKIGEKVKVYARSRTEGGYVEGIYMGLMDDQPMVKIEETGRILNTRRIIEDGEVIYTVNIRDRVLSELIPIEPQPLEVNDTHG